MLRRNRLAACAVGLSLLLAACGGGGDDDEPNASDTTEADSGDDGGDGAISEVSDVENAVTRIVAEGTFVEPGDALAAIETTGVGSGSGFIVDAEGTTVTNNHVVAGAATLEVYIGNSDEPLNAKVLGVSECNDLAVIDLEGDGYPFLRWDDAEPDTGLEVRAAGFPLGDPQFTMTQGIVSKSEAAGDTPWASIPFTIEHDANIQPGNSGGPLISAEDASVVAVNYATNDPGTGTNQFFAISASEARDVVEELRDGNVLSLGVNGQAIYNEEFGVIGIWVASVESGSPADDAGVLPGDVIERIEGLPMATDGTMKDYCDVLRSHDEGDVLKVQVLRVEEGARLQGEFNGDPLQPYESLVDDVEESTGGVLTGGEAYEYTTVTDDTGLLVVDVPTAWSDVRTDTIELESGGELPQIIAAPSVDGYLETYETPGMSFGVNLDGSITLDDFLSSSDFSGDCVSDGPEPYEDPLYSGQIQYWTDCAGTGAVIVVIAAEPPGGEFAVRVVAQLLSETDAEALDRIIQTFRVDLGE